MAARIRQPEAWRFYVYEVLDAQGRVIYVGKGTGRRKDASRRQRGGESVREMARFYRESDAYAHEVNRIAELAPPLNKHAGGNGSKATPKRASRYFAAIEAMGARRYAARLLLAYAPLLGYPLSKVEQVRRVAYG